MSKRVKQANKAYAKSLQPVFSRNQSIPKMAFMNWRMSEGSDILNLLNIADGFMQSSVEIAIACIEDNDDKKADILIFPILANANHAIELYFKAIIWTLNKLMNINQRTEGSHNIHQLYHVVRSKVFVYKGKELQTEFDSTTIELKEYINELFARIGGTSKNDNMDFSRYPFDAKYRDHFYVKEFMNTEVDLENFLHRFQTIHEKIKDFAEHLYWREYLQDDLF